MSRQYKDMIADRERLRKELNATLGVMATVLGEDNYKVVRKLLHAYNVVNFRRDVLGFAEIETLDQDKPFAGWVDSPLDDNNEIALEYIAALKVTPVKDVRQTIQDQIADINKRLDVCYGDNKVQVQELLSKETNLRLNISALKAQINAKSGALSK